MKLYSLFLSQCVRLREIWVSLIIITILGFVGIANGYKHLTSEQEAIAEVAAYQKKHIDRQVTYHNDDLGLLLYYAKFAFIHQAGPLAGLSIGQADVHPSIKRLTIKTFEAQKFDIDLINPTSVQSGNLDLAFVIIYLFPLLVIVLSFNSISEETESGTWRIVATQAKSKLVFVLKKLSVRVLLLLVVLSILLFSAKFILGIPFNVSFLVLILASVLYVLFWFALAFFVITFKKSSRFNALMLLSSWLVLIVLLPSGINAYLTSKYPVPEALNTAIAQRDGYHVKWDTDKRETIEKFYNHYPQFKKYGYPTDGFNWLWYYAMQQMGDDDSREERTALQEKINTREEASKKIAAFLPNMHLQLSYNKLAGTSLKQHLDFLDAAEDFHERLRLSFYPSVFELKNADTIDWDQIIPEHYTSKTNEQLANVLFPLMIGLFIFFLISIPKARQL